MATKKTKSTAPLEDLTRVSKEEAERVLRLLAYAVRKSQRSRRAIERNLGWSQGYLGSILRGRIALKVWHVFALSRELKLEPMSFFLIVAPPRDPSWILEQLGIEPVPAQPVPPKPKAKRQPVDFDELEEMTRKLLVEELARYGLLEPEPAHSK